MGTKAYARVESGSTIATQDATGTPITSPKTVSTSVITLVCPDNAKEFVITNVDQDLRVSDVVGMARYFVYPASATSELRIPVAGASNIYLLRDGVSDAVTQFYFTIG